MTSAPIRKTREFALLGVLALLWGSSYLFIKIAVAEIPPISLIALRVSVAAILLVALVAWRGRRFPRRLSDWRMFMLQAWFNSIAAWTVLAWGQRHVDSGLASVLNSTSPIFVFLFTALVTRHEPAPPRKLLGACLGLGGVVLIVGPSALQGLGSDLAGQIAVLSGALLYACAAIYGRRFSHLPAEVTAAGTMICASAVLVPASLLVDRPWQLSPSLAALAAALALAVLCTALALVLYFRLVRTLGSMGVASQAYLRAGVGVALGVLLLGESIALSTGLGLVAALLGVVLINTRAGP
ncbi:hypothetical protein LL06_05175 [Hoeflea sp. BAL378]|uniref:DMT family transporter n=1 Tax=Hoeflea sp. BAL378 TaxID=1547437 RepID=UPI000512EE65|nr:EamA family transporter [Hoeflea sp. BAL378]KGF70502.1 hypothetical protein LL06_05175 [Hoeflea sp. BAL378]